MTVNCLNCNNNKKKLFIQLFVLSLPDYMLTDFRKRGREGEREGKKHRCERETSSFIGLVFYILQPGIEPTI